MEKQSQISDRKDITNSETTPIANQLSIVVCEAVTGFENSLILTEPLMIDRTIVARSVLALTMLATRSPALEHLIV